MTHLFSPSLDSERKHDEPREAIIRFDKVSKTFRSGDGEHAALHDISADIFPGSIFGIIGLSGAGKSTLVRLINGIEQATLGEVIVEGQKLSQLNARQGRKLRTTIGMIFQSCNLMPSRTVRDNILLPLQDKDLSREEREQRVDSLLELVGLSGRERAYPNELSGGQQQRVAIARALANNPRILLCDEATSALDPATTTSILDLIRTINRNTGVTVVMVTHQMSVIKHVCDEVMVLDHGTVVEQGSVYSIFVNPHDALTRTFIETTSNLGRINDLIHADNPAITIGKRQRLIRLQYSKEDVSEPLVSLMTARFGVLVNILLSDIESIGGRPIGGLVATIEGSAENIESALDFLRKKDVRVEVIEHV
ncbi:methionine ABC transporter ATP-binding protein [Bifidobacterium aquikefiri]|uniref:D-methionine ABC transporter ATP-binding protein n=1 Tax=Bifidobacterium aquikefiri TaxID=1653207 RepID=A0A261GBY3_9BIFI|nr:ATP-binding cassette domain-containing protein [Bifidobacterium aquikefiri]OZG68753.1 d-methionine ABC transporter ATP-binding protein [Bifidobacterium aquikefiri]